MSLETIVFFRSLATWPLSPPPDPEGWRHLKIQLTGANACGHTFYLSISGLEIYGEVRGLADEELGTVVKNIHNVDVLYKPHVVINTKQVQL